MNKHVFSKKQFSKRLGLMILCLGFSAHSSAQMQWSSYTMDNDLFVGNDSGYTNGLYVSLYDTDNSTSPPTPQWLTKILAWSLPEKTLGAYNSYTVGQTMLTPSDITVEIPSKDDLPYAALLYLNNAHITISHRHQQADKISTSVGVVGPWALGEEAQKFVHSLTGSDDPKGWDTQLKNEVVFQLARAHTWRSWVSKSQHMDIVNTAEFSLGTISSNMTVNSVFRYGSRLQDSFSSFLLGASRASNPLAANGGWYTYIGIGAAYNFNQIFTDGNTFSDSRSIETDRESVGGVIGITKSWRSFAFSFAINDTNLIDEEDNKDLKDMTRFGSFTLAFRI